MTIGTVTATPNTLAVNSLTQQDFLKILLTQLNYQDPMKPMDNQQFMAQMAQFTSLEQTQQLNSKLELLIGNQAALASVGLLGKTVDATTGSGSITGTVTGLSLAGSTPVATVRTSSGASVPNVSLSQITAVR